MSTPIRTWSPDSAIRPTWNRNAAPTDRGTSAGWPGCWPSRWPRWPGRGTPSRCGIARSAPRRRTGCCRMRSGRRSRRRSWTAPGWRRPGMTWGCGGSRSATPPITFTSWPRWPARTAPGRGSGTTSTGSGKPARTPRRRFGLRPTAPADRTAARRPSRAETEQAVRRGWGEPPRVTLRREVCTAAAGAGTEQEFFARLGEAGVLVRKRYSTTSPGEVTGYAVGLPGHTAKDGGVVWYGGGKLAADLTLPKLRRRWAGPARARPFPGRACRLRRRAPCSATSSPQAAEQAPGRGRVLRPAAGGRGAGAAAVQRDLPGPGHRLRRRPPRPRRPRRRRPCGTAAGGWPPG